MVQNIKHPIVVQDVFALLPIAHFTDWQLVFKGVLVNLVFTVFHFRDVKLKPDNWTL